MLVSGPTGTSQMPSVWRQVSTMNPTASALVGCTGRLGEVGAVEPALAVDVVGVAGSAHERPLGAGVHRHVDAEQVEHDRARCGSSARAVRCRRPS